MKLSFILSQARNGELAGLSQIDKSDEKVIEYINLGLIALYTRFQLVTEEAIISLHAMPAKTIYTLDSTDPDVQVNGAAMPTDDCMVILEAYGEGGSRIPINDDTNPLSLFTVAYNKLQIPLLEDNTYISIIYKKNPTMVQFIDAGQGAATETNVELPTVLLEPLLHYIGYRAHGAVNGSVQTENSTHYTRYEASCNKVLEMGGLPVDDNSTTALYRKGFL